MRRVQFQLTVNAPDPWRRRMPSYAGCRSNKLRRVSEHVLASYGCDAVSIHSQVPRRDAARFGGGLCAARLHS
jgi:hypothetical protein